MVHTGLHYAVPKQVAAQLVKDVRGPHWLEKLLLAIQEVRIATSAPSELLSCPERRIDKIHSPRRRGVNVLDQAPAHNGLDRQGGCPAVRLDVDRQETSGVRAEDVQAQHYRQTFGSVDAVRGDDQP